MEAREVSPLEARSVEGEPGATDAATAAEAAGATLVLDRLWGSLVHVSIQDFRRNRVEKHST